MLSLRRLVVTVFWMRLLYDALPAVFLHLSLSSIKQHIWSVGPRESSSPVLNPFILFDKNESFNLVWIWHVFYFYLFTAINIQIPPSITLTMFIHYVRQRYFLYFNQYKSSIFCTHAYKPIFKHTLIIQLFNIHWY